MQLPDDVTKAFLTAKVRTRTIPRLIGTGKRALLFVSDNAFGPTNSTRQAFANELLKALDSSFLEGHLTRE